jgi:crotonobetainyl-CoA:carnitine CoA-transferase CaiB-like acyl-CoA transferase
MTDKYLLDGIRVVELATFVFGPAAGTILGDFGADVVHIRRSAMPIVICRNCGRYRNVRTTTAGFSRRAARSRSRWMFAARKDTT